MKRKIKVSRHAPGIYKREGKRGSTLHILRNNTDYFSPATFRLDLKLLSELKLNQPHSAAGQQMKMAKFSYDVIKEFLFSRSARFPSAMRAGGKKTTLHPTWQRFPGSRSGPYCLSKKYKHKLDVCLQFVYILCLDLHRLYAFVKVI